MVVFVKKSLEHAKRHEQCNLKLKSNIQHSHPAIITYCNILRVTDRKLTESIDIILA